MITQAQAEDLIEQNKRLLEQQTLLQQQNMRLQEQLDWAMKQLFGSKSERHASGKGDDDPISQLGLFGTVIPEPTTDPDDHAPTVVPQHTRKKRKTNPGRNPIPDHLERRVELIDPEGVERIVDAEGNVSYPGYIIIGTESSERVVFEPAQMYVLVTERPVLSKLTDRSVHVAALPDRVLAKSLADESLVVEAMIAKFCDHQPIYRQVAAWQRDYDLCFSRATVAGWVDRSATYLRVLHDAMRQKLLTSNYLQMDESSILVLAPPDVNTEDGTSVQPKRKGEKLIPKGGKDAKRHKGWMWLARDPVSGLVLFEYHQGRSHHLPLDLLEGYEGYLQIDGYEAYRTAMRKLDKAADRLTAAIVIICCMAHIRRKFFDAQNSHPKACDEALEMIKAMYAEEAKCRDLSAEQRLAHRKQHLAPLFAKFEN